MSNYNSNGSQRDNWQDRGRSRYSRYNNSYNRPQFNNRNNTPSLTENEDQLVNQGKDELFDKKKNFPLVTSLKDISLLLSHNLFTTDRWEIKELIELKQKLNNTRDRLNEKDIKVWKQHTGKTNMTARVVWGLRDRNCIEMCTNAWIKMAEIFSKYHNLIPKDLPDGQPFRTMHVCEAPGAFICATNFYQNQTYRNRRQWEWTGLSLNPYYEGNDQEAMVDDDRFIVETLDKWYFGKDNSGNILDTNNIKGLWNRIRTHPSSSGVHLVTGDGSVDTSGDPNEQESIVSELHYTEAVCAMGALEKGGSIVLKMFNLFECETICLLYILALHFKELSIFKPASSRAPNGETYIVAVGFRGIAPEVLHSLLSFVSPTFPPGKALLPLNSIPPSFLTELIKIADYFTIKQIQALERNLELEKIWNRNIQEAIFQLNQDIVKEFRQRCFIDYNSTQSVRIVNNVTLDGSAKALGNSAAVVKGGLRQRSGGTLEDRQNKKRDREEFLLSNTDKNDNDSNDESIEDKTTKKQKLDHGKTVIFGQNISTKSTESESATDMDIDSSNNRQIESTGDSWAMKMLKKSGLKEGQGLGAHGQGRTTPVEAVVHDNRFGLGHHNQTTISSSSSSSLPLVTDEPLFSSYDQPISSKSFSQKLLNHGTMIIGENLRQVLSSLFVKFDDLEKLYKKREEYYKRIEDKTVQKTKIFISDQLEYLNKEGQYRDEHGIYIDYQTAYQLASLDKIFKLTTTDANNSSRLLFLIDNKSLTGFAEYLVWQQEDYVNGIIISDLQIPVPFSSSVIYKSKIDYNYSKVHLFCSDVSILPVNQNRRYIEQYNKHQLLLSCRHALTILNEGGHFVCKILDTLTRFTTGLIYLLYRSFKSICILRPFTLDPSTSERFLVCCQLKSPVNQSIIQHLDYLLKYKNIENILEVVPLKCLIESEFLQYMADTNQRLLQREIQAINKRLWYIDHQDAQQIDTTIEQGDWNEARRCVTNPRRPKPPPVEPDSGIELPVDWTKGWSKTEERFYYFNTRTGESRWDPPN